ncbi:hypothetical protein VNO78_33709 [Psophocarpus tetragonolobus]|uniref:Uncharacterized protein n=1 Tax=Psophocarpus tetragonolobus TaxID=3891 RepID=A0AAN9NXH0_PSOTE
MMYKVVAKTQKIVVGAGTIGVCNKRSGGWLEMLLECCVFTGNLQEGSGFDSLHLAVGRLGNSAFVAGRAYHKNRTTAPLQWPDTAKETSQLCSYLILVIWKTIESGF